MPNDIKKLINNYPNISKILLNGTKAVQLFKRYFGDVSIEWFAMPSTSPMMGKNVKSIDEKKVIWKEALLKI